MSRYEKTSHKKHIEIDWQTVFYVGIFVIAICFIVFLILGFTDAVWHREQIVSINSGTVVGRESYTTYSNRQSIYSNRQSIRNFDIYVQRDDGIVISVKTDIDQYINIPQGTQVSYTVYRSIGKIFGWYKQ